MNDPWTTPLDPRIPDGATVLVVEDDANVRRALRRMLELIGMVVVEAAHGGQAIDAIEADRDGRLDAVVTDLRMPVVSGAELIAVLLECRPDLPVVAVTAVDELMAAVQGVPVLHKPFTEEELMGTLVPQMARARAARAQARAIADPRVVAKDLMATMSDLRATLARVREQLGPAPIPMPTG